MTTCWIVIGGKAEVADGTVTYTPSPIAEGPSAGQNTVTVLRSNMEFKSGEVTYEAYLNEPASACQVGLNIEGGGKVFAGLNFGAFAYGLALFPKQSVGNS